MLLRLIAGRGSVAGSIAAMILLGWALGCAPSSDGEPSGSGEAAAVPALTGPPGSSPRNRFPMLDRLEWLAGSWVGEKDGRRYEEHWLPAAGGMMLGLHREVGRSGLGSFEYIRILGLPSGARYIASPSGRPATHFPLTASDVRSATFENPEHDFPRRITYWLEGDELHARIDGERNGIAEIREWVFRRSERGLHALAPEPETEPEPKEEVEP